jgi:hypothetical protein
LGGEKDVGNEGGRDVITFCWMKKRRRKNCDHDQKRELMKDLGQYQDLDNKKRN